VFPTHFPVLPILQLLVVGFIVVLALVFTANPLSLFGMFFAWSPPPLVEKPDAQPPKSEGMGFLSGGEPNAGGE
jgi:hypothetical protein